MGSFGIVEFVVGGVDEVEEFLFGQISKLKHEEAHLNPVFVEHSHLKSGVSLLFGNSTALDNSYIC